MKLINYQWLTFGGQVTNEPIDAYNHLIDALRYSKTLFVTNSNSIPNIYTMIKATINGNTVEFPTSWEEVKFGQYLKLITAKTDTRKRCAFWDLDQGRPSGRLRSKASK